MRMGLSQALVLMLICMFSAACCILVTNDRFTKALEFTNESVASNLDDVDQYLKNTGEEFRYLVTDMYEVIHEALQKDITNLGMLTEQEIFGSLRVSAVIMDTRSLDSHLSDVSVLLTKAANDISMLENTTTALTSALETLADEVDNTTTTCSSNCQPNFCGDVDTAAFRRGGINSSAFPDFNNTRNETDQVRSANNFTAIALKALTNLEAISDEIDDFASDIKSAVNSSLMDYRDIVRDLSSGVFETMSTAFPAEDLKRQSKNIFDTVGVYDKYRRWFGVGLTTVFIGLVLLFVVAMALGIIYYDSSVLPTERSSGSNVGGYCLLTGVVLLFIIGALFLTLTVLVFLCGALLEKSCEPFEDLTMFKDFLDNDRVSGYSLSKNVLGEETIRLSTYDTLMGCRADKTPWTVLKIGEIVPLEKVIKYINYLGNIGQDLQDIESVDISRFHVLTKEMKSGLTQIEDLGLTSINFTELFLIVNQPVVSFDIDAALSVMDSLRDACAAPTKMQWSDHRASLESIQDKEVVDVEKAADQVRLSLQALNKSIVVLSNLTSSILVTALAADSQIQNNMSQVLLQASVGLLGRMFSMLDSYASEVVYLIYNNLGNCLPLWNLYKSVVVVVCDYGVDTLNGYWFSIGWGLFFFGPIIVVATKLAKHYKTMEYADGYTECDNAAAGKYTPDTAENEEPVVKPLRKRVKPGSSSPDKENSETHTVSGQGQMMEMTDMNSAVEQTEMKDRSNNEVKKETGT